MHTDNISISDVFGSSCSVIAEIAQAHDGSLGYAHAFIDAIATTNADAIKFQTHIADAESTIDEPWRVKFSFQDDTRYDYWKRMQFSAEEWLGLKSHAEDKGLIFLSSPFSIQSAILLEKIGVKAWKIASGEVTNHQLIHYLCSTKKPLLISSGLSSYDEIASTVNVVDSYDCDFALFQCTSEYPTAPERIGLNVLSELSTRFQCPVGLSDHSGEIFAGLAAATLGASFVEVHATMSQYMFGPDVSSSLTIDEIRSLSHGISRIKTMQSNPIQKDSITEEATRMKLIFGKGAYASTDLDKNQPLSWDCVEFKKPCKGIPVSRWPEFLGLPLKVAIKKGSPITSQDILTK